jgi:hypothetical protein
MPIDPGLDARVQAVAHLSTARALVMCSFEALDEANEAPDFVLDGFRATTRHLDDMADALLENQHVAHVLRTIEEVIASGESAVLTRHGRAHIVQEMLAARAAARQDEVV